MSTRSSPEIKPSRVLEQGDTSWATVCIHQGASFVGMPVPRSPLMSLKPFAFYAGVPKNTSILSLVTQSSSRGPRVTSIPSFQTKELRREHGESVLM